MDDKEYASIARQAVADGMVKIGIPIDEEVGPSLEWCWAKRVSATHAKLDNCCMFSDVVGFGDIVEFRELDDADGGPHELLKVLVRVVTRGSTQCLCEYATEQESADSSPASNRSLSSRLRAIRLALESLPEEVRPIYVEGMFPGFACVAFPAAVTPEQADAFVAACPFVIQQHDED